ncbi:MAG: hypothetical protein QOI41_2193, partial [Myxococcales bacterium]|nr:hypothetical protein [Myxococcales bacterium]
MNLGLSFATGAAALLAGCLPDYPTDMLRRSPTGGSAIDEGSASSSSSPPAVAAATIAPEFGATVSQADPPPPLSGGTMAVAPDGKTIVAADPDRDRVYVVDYHDASTLRTIALSLHDEPGRVVVDAANRAHVALRSGGAIVTIDLASNAIIARRDACSAPRGLAYDAVADVVHVACAGGELVTFPAAGGAEVRRRMLMRDLRDVIVVPGAIIVSTFRDARTYRIADGADIAVERHRLESPTWGSPAVAWRMVALPTRSQPPTSSWDDIDDVLIAAQKVPASGDDVSVPPPVPAAYYTDDGSSPVLPGTSAPPDPCAANGPGPVVLDRHLALHLPDAPLPVDVAASPDWLAVVAAANGHTPSLPQLVFVNRYPIPPEDGDTLGCFPGASGVNLRGLQLTSVVFVDDVTVVALSREPAALVVVGVTSGSELARIALATDSREDTGHAIFHSNSGVGVACASCHPDGRDDGHAWKSIEL